MLWCFRIHQDHNLFSKTDNEILYYKKMLSISVYLDWELKYSRMSKYWLILSLRIRLWNKSNRQLFNFTQNNCFKSTFMEWIQQPKWDGFPDPGSHGDCMLGIDNIVFISILTVKLPKEQQRKRSHFRFSFCTNYKDTLLLSITGWWHYPTII